jgi:Domain of unknown function (DUF5017)
MKKYIKFLTASSLAILSVASCRNLEITEPSEFNVSTSATTFKVGENVQFNFTGAADQVIFYSGEIGKVYANKDRSLATTGTTKLVFQSSMQQGLLPNGDSLRLLVSTNLAGYDEANVKNAKWTDITSRNTKFPTSLATTFTTSDSVNVTDFNTADNVNFAFRFIGKKNDKSAQRKWAIQNVTLTNVQPDGTSTPVFNTFANAGWVQASLKNLPNAWNVGTANISATNSVLNTSGATIRTAYPITFDPGTALNTDENDDWLISSAFNLKTVKPDVGVSIKSAVNATLTKYSYIFRTAGTYNITFVGQNLNTANIKNVPRQLQITITK